jgi:DNA polymerase II large subunit
MIADLSTQKYFNKIDELIADLYKTADRVKAKELDPTNKTEIYKAQDLAARVEGLIGVEGVAERIRTLNAQFSREDTAFKMIEEVINGNFGKYDDRTSAEKALRIALAIVTEGITAAPLQGIEKVEIKTNSDGRRYLAVHYAGPMRSAGGTEQALTVLFADYVRVLLHIDRYQITEREIGRFIEELRLYERSVTRFQYHPTDEDLRKILPNLPIEVTGPPTDTPQVSVYRNLDRIETNNVRGGALRVINDGVYGKAAKLKKIVDKVGIPGWDWLEVQKEENEENVTAKISPDIKYLIDIVGGRPIFSHPSMVGGFRLRYGRARNTGLAAVGLHPATMIILESFIAVGTQLRVERPGKSSTITPVDTIEGPIVKLKNGDVMRIEDEITAERVKANVEEILFLGDMLVSVGEFLENNHRLMPAGYCEEIWAAELRNVINEKFESRYDILADKLGLRTERLHEFVESPLIVKPTSEEALSISSLLSIPLHPRYTYFWENISIEEILILQEWLRESLKRWIRGKLEVSITNPVPKKILEKVGAPHKFINGAVVFEDAPIFKALFLPTKSIKGFSEEKTVDFLSKSAGIKLLAKGRSFIGARMGRPEKAKGRVMRPPIHVLFPVNLAGGSQRDITKAVKKGNYETSLILKQCAQCKTTSYENMCKRCNIKTVQIYNCPKCDNVSVQGLCPKCGNQMMPFKNRLISIKDYEQMLNKLGVKKEQVVKGVRGLSNPTKTPEILEKGILRSKHKIFVYKDGTIRFDITNAPITHFKPLEIQTSIEKLKELGYNKDYKGNDLIDPNQLIELKVQDIILPESGGKYLYRVTKYTDELLTQIYQMESFYNLKSYDELVGQLVIGLAPHTSAGIAGRIIGFTRASVCYAHPFWHAAKRRNCDGDEDSVMLALEALIDFSKAYLPEKIGGLMDAPLVMTTIIDPSEVDDECHNMETVELLPLEFYTLGENYKEPKEALKIIQIIKNRLGKPEQYTNFSFSIYTQGIDTGPLTTSYDKLKTMMDKVKKQLQLANKIKAVDSKDVAERLLKHHFIPDLAGNMRAFSTQTFRCTKCGAKYRRIPLNGFCVKCKGNLILTVHEGNINKYLQAASTLSKDYELGVFMDQQISLIEKGLRMLIPPSKKGNMELEQFMESKGLK